MLRRPLLIFASPFLAACFGESPDGTGGDDGSSSSTTSSSSSDTTESSSTADTSSSGATSTSDPDTSSSGASSEGSSSESTGEPPDECACPDGAVECESFEGDFDPDSDTWSIPPGGADPVVVDAPVHCGEAALRTLVMPGDSYSALSHTLPAELFEPGVHRVGAWVQLHGDCTTSATRILQVQLANGAQYEFRYGIELYVDEDGFELRLQDAMGVYEPTDMEFPLAEDTWYDVVLELDLSVQPPPVTVIVDGVTVIAAEGPTMTLAAPDPRLSASVGLFRPAPFDGVCTAIYDDFTAG